MKSFRGCLGRAHRGLGVIRWARVGRAAPRSEAQGPQRSEGPVGPRNLPREESAQRRGNLSGRPVAANKPEAHRTQRACAVPAPGFTANTRPWERTCSRKGRLRTGTHRGNSLPARIQLLPNATPADQRRGQRTAASRRHARSASAEWRSKGIADGLLVTPRHSRRPARRDQGGTPPKTAQQERSSTRAPHRRGAMPHGAGSARWHPGVPTRAAHLPRAPRR